MQPSQSPSDRMLTALVLHVVSTILSKRNDPLVQPFVAILVNPQALKVSVYILCKICLDANSIRHINVHNEKINVKENRDYIVCVCVCV